MVISNKRYLDGLDSDIPTASRPPSKKWNNTNSENVKVTVRNENAIDISLSDDDFGPVEQNSTTVANHEDPNSIGPKSVDALEPASAAENNINDPQATEQSLPNLEQPLPEDPSYPHNNTYFLALDKCLPKRKYLEIIQVKEHTLVAPSSASVDDAADGLEYDLEWLAITRALHPFYSPLLHQTPLPRDQDRIKA